MFIVKYSGPFGFIKPWTAVRDNETYSQNFLTPSIIEGIDKKLFPELLEQIKYERRIIRHRLTYTGISRQQEQTQPRAIKETKRQREGIIVLDRPRSIITRGVMIDPILFLGFTAKEHAAEAAKQHICLCRNEDVLLPQPFTENELIKEVKEEDFDKADNGYNGFELMFGKNKQSFIVGFNRFNSSEPMYGWINIIGGNPLIKREIS